jgi:hypothetical protein
MMSSLLSVHNARGKVIDNQEKHDEKLCGESSHFLGENALGPLPIDAEPLLRALKEPPLSSSFWTEMAACGKPGPLNTER